MKKPNLKRLRVCYDNTKSVYHFTLDCEKFKIVDSDDFGQAAYEASLKSIPWELEDDDYAFSEKAAHYAKVHKINLDKLFTAYDQWARFECDRLNNN